MKTVKPTKPLKHQNLNMVLESLSKTNQALDAKKATQAEAREEWKTSDKAVTTKALDARLRVVEKLLGLEK